MGINKSTLLIDNSSEHYLVVKGFIILPGSSRLISIDKSEIHEIKEVISNIKNIRFEFIDLEIGETPDIQEDEGFVYISKNGSELIKIKINKNEIKILEV